MKKKIVQNKSYENSYDYKQGKVWEVRSQKFAIKGLFRGSGGRAPEAIGGLGAEPQRLKILHFFFK